MSICLIIPFVISGLFRDNVRPILPSVNHFRDQLHGGDVVYGQKRDLRGCWRPQVLWPLPGRGLLHCKVRSRLGDGHANLLTAGLAELRRWRGLAFPEQAHKVTNIIIDKMRGSAYNDENHGFIVT